MPTPVRYRSTTAVYDEGGADRGATRARQSKCAPAPEFGHRFDRHARSAIPALPQQMRTPHPGGRDVPPQVAMMTVGAPPQ
jgi:hypothetical protein